MDPSETLLVVSPGVVDLSDVDPSQITLVEPVEHARHGKAVPGMVVRDQALRTTADIIVVVSDPAALVPGWLPAAAAVMSDRVGAVVLSYPGDQFADMVCPQGAATLLRVDQLCAAGGFQPQFDDEGQLLDAVWRLRARGATVATLDGHVSTASQPSTPTVSTLLAVAAYNLEPDSLRTVLPALTLAIVTEPLYRTGTDTSRLDLQRSPGGDDIGTLAVDPAALIGADQANRLIDLLAPAGSAPVLTDLTRRRSDRMLAKPIQRYVDYLWSVIGGNRELLEGAFPATLQPVPQLHVYVIGTIDPTDEGGQEQPLAQVLDALTREFAVHYWNANSRESHEFTDGHWKVINPTPAQNEAWADAVVLSGVNMRPITWLARSQIPVLVDTTDWNIQRSLVEDLPGSSVASDNRGVQTQLLDETMRRADHVLTSDEEHRDALLGLMAGLGRISTRVYDENHALTNLVAVPRGGDLAAAVVEWCRESRRAADLVTSFERSLPVQRQRRIRLSKLWSKR